jgi:thiamine pyrophosphokinase
MTKYAIVANGCFLTKKIIQEATENKIIIALDGAGPRLLKLGIRPDIILGDFDSSTLAELQTLAHTHDLELVHAEDQSFTDFSKAIHYCDTHDATHITVLCALGGRIDHHLGLLRSLRKHYQKNRPILLHDLEQSALFIRDESMQVHGVVGDQCGVLAFPEATISTNGLTYDAQDYQLTFGISESTCNTMRKPIATITVTGEALVVLPPMLKAQRMYLQQTPCERLQHLLADLQASGQSHNI